MKLIHLTQKEIDNIDNEAFSSNFKTDNASKISKWEQDKTQIMTDIMFKAGRIFEMDHLIILTKKMDSKSNGLKDAFAYVCHDKGLRPVEIANFMNNSLVTTHRQINRCQERIMKDHIYTELIKRIKQ